VPRGGKLLAMDTARIPIIRTGTKEKGKERKKGKGRLVSRL
jgi:hypothetical protein